MAYQFTEFDERRKELVDWLSKEFSQIRTGRATPALIDGIKVDSYGAKVPLQQVGSVGVEDARTLRVSLWDPGQIKDVEKAIIDADLGISVVTDDKGLRVVFPELTHERREQLIKIAKGKLEDARVSLRGARDDAMKEIEKLKKDGEIGEDEQFTFKEELQERVDKTNKELDEMQKNKETEINQ